MLKFQLSILFGHCSSPRYTSFCPK